MTYQLPGCNQDRNSDEVWCLNQKYPRTSQIIDHTVMNANAQRVWMTRQRCSGSSSDDCIKNRTRTSFLFFEFLSQFFFFCINPMDFCCVGSRIYFFLNSKSDILCDPRKLWNCSVPFNKSAPLISVHAVNHPQHSISYDRAHNVCLIKIKRNIISLVWSHISHLSCIVHIIPLSLSPACFFPKHKVHANINQQHQQTSKL